MPWRWGGGSSCGAGRLSAAAVAAAVLVACAPGPALTEGGVADDVVADSADADEILEASLLTYAGARSFVDEGEMLRSWGQPSSARASFRLSFARERGFAFSSSPELEVDPSGESAAAAPGRGSFLIDDGGRIVTDFDDESAAEQPSQANAFRHLHNEAGSAEVLLSLLLADPDSGRRGGSRLHDVSLVLPSSRAGCHELHASDESGKELTFFIGKLDHLLYEWREHWEYPVLRAEEDGAFRIRQELIAKGGYDWLERYGAEETPSYAVERTFTFHPQLDAEISEAAFDLAPMRTVLAADLIPSTVEGIGVGVAPSALGWTVGRLVEGPARRAGVRRGDLIVEVNGVDVTRHSSWAASKLIRGPAGSPVRLALLRGDQWLEIPMQRELVVLPVDW